MDGWMDGWIDGWMDIFRADASADIETEGIHQKDQYWYSAGRLLHLCPSLHDEEMSLHK